MKKICTNIIENYLSNFILREKLLFCLFNKKEIEDLFLYLLNKNVWIIEYIKNPTEKIKLKAVKKNGRAIFYIKDPTEEMKLEAVKSNGLAIQDIENQTEEMKFEALKQNLDANGFQKGEILNREKLETFRATLEDHYHSVGRYNAQVNTIVNPLPNHRSEIKLQIKENDVALLKELNFVGNHVFSKSKLQDQMELQPL